MRRGALRSALSERLREGNLVVVEELVFDQPKTKDFIGALAALGLEGKTLIVDTIDNDNLMLAARNVKRAKVVGSLRREHLRRALPREARADARGRGGVADAARPEEGGRRRRRASRPVKRTAHEEEAA